MINMVKVRHNNVVPTMALGVQQLKKELGRSRKVPFEFDEIHEFLDRFYMSRISIHMLIGQHVALHDPKPEPGVIGLINIRLSPIQVAQAACEDARSVCLREYVSAPDINIYGDPNFTFPGNYGVSHLLERMAFKSTVNRTHLRLVREVEAIGGNVSASASREQMSYTYDALKSYTPEMVEVLIDNVRNPAFLDWEVKEQYLTENNYFVMIRLLSSDKKDSKKPLLVFLHCCLSSCSKTIAVLQVVAAPPTPASAIGFEGYEKHLEISFYEAPVFADPNGRGFLFVYPYKILIKTCGTTKLLLAIPRILELAKELSLPLVAAKYSRGTFIFPDAQPSPNKNFVDEVSFLITSLMASDKKRAYVFFKTSIDGYTSCAKDMTKLSVVLAARPWHSGSMGRGCGLFNAYYSRESVRCLLNLVEVEFSYDADIDLVFIDLPVLEQERYRWTLEIVV
uniref:Protein-serine/threonine kinase n=1 Tax=Zea mays TaxID=4577 RepID=A0A804R940_MAIZE